MRLFIAIELPAELRRALGALHCDLPGARWVPAEQIHLTLAFLGEVEEEKMAELHAELARIHFPPFTLTLTGTGCFPSRQRPRVLWVELAPQPLLAALAAAVQGAILACALPVEARPFSPHLTLARLKAPLPGGAGAFLDQAVPQDLPALPVREFILFASCLTETGALHLPLKIFPLSLL